MRKSTSKFRIEYVCSYRQMQEVELFSERGQAYIRFHELTKDLTTLFAKLTQTETGKILGEYSKKK